MAKQKSIKDQFNEVESLSQVFEFVENEEFVFTNVCERQNAFGEGNHSFEAITSDGELILLPTHVDLMKKIRNAQSKVKDLSKLEFLIIYEGEEKITGVAKPIKRYWVGYNDIPF